MLFVGYQSVGTLGRVLVDGAEKVKLFGETVMVNAHIEQLAGISGHADNKGLMRWISAFSPQPEHVFVVHGDDETCETFTNRLHDELGLEASAPYNGEIWNLDPPEMITEGNKVRLKKKTNSTDETQRVEVKPEKMQQKPNLSTAYGQLLAAVEKLCRLADRMQNRSGKEQTKLTKAIYALLKKYHAN